MILGIRDFEFFQSETKIWEFGRCENHLKFDLAGLVFNQICARNSFTGNIFHGGSNENKFHIFIFFDFRKFIYLKIFIIFSVFNYLLPNSKSKDVITDLFLLLSPNQSLNISQNP